jgi:flavin-dependent dehydrogenase
LSDFPALQRRLANAEYTSTDRGSTTTTRRLRRIFRERTALIGDASGSVDAIAGEGLSLAFLQAIALADAIVAGDLRAYQTTHRQLIRSPLVMANLLLLLDRFTWIRPLIWKGLALEPSLLGRVLAFYAPAGLGQPL